ncbi:girdin-like [Poecilia latipinna]|uniref:girdin-like n=1 Tax=Poecilia latipinna TaxID=48699 RepID=UPI00072E8652|nr:PREDICTED: girdin-like [Poecilia latipinna]
MFPAASSLQNKALLRSEKNEKLLMEENKKCKKEIASLVEDNLKLQKEIRLFKDGLKEEGPRKDKIKELQETISDLQNKEEERVKNLSKIQEENIALQKEVKTLSNKNAIQTIWREQQAKDLEGFDKLKKEAKLMASDISQLKKQKDDLKEREQQNLNKIQELQNLLQSEQTKSKNAEKALRIERLDRQNFSEKDKEILTTLNDKVEGLQRKKNGLLDELNKSRNQAKSLKNDNEMLTEEIRRERMRNKELSELLEAKTLESDQLQTELQSKDEHLRGMKEEAIKARNIIHWMELELQKLSLQSEKDRKRNKRVVSTINEQIKGLKKEVKEKEDNEAKLLMQVSALKDQIKDAEDKLCDVQTDLSESEKENASLKEVNKGLDGDITALQAELANAKSENQLLHNQLEQLRKQMEETEANNEKKLSMLDRELTMVRDSLTGTEEERQGLTNKLDECLEAVFKSSRKLNQLQNQNSEAEEKVKELTKENNNLLEENKKLKLFKAYWLFLSETIMDKIND